MAFRFVAIQPKGTPINIARLNSEIDKAFKETTDALERRFDLTTSTYSSERPTFSTKVVSSEERLTSTSNDKYFFLNFGTRRRWAVMSSFPPYIAKTRPGSIKPFAGQGQVIIAGKRAMIQRNMKPRPGIKARNFATTIAVATQSQHERNVLRALRNVI